MKLFLNRNNLGCSKGYVNKVTDPSDIVLKGTHAICTITWAAGINFHWGFVYILYCC